MIGFIIKIALALVSLISTVSLFANGYWGWGIVMILVTAFIGLFFFRHERIIMAFYYMRLGNQEKAKYHFNKITHPNLLPKKQHAFVIYMQAVLGSQELGLAKSEQMLRRALSMGLRTKHDNAIARMHLAGVCAQTGRRQEALHFLAEAKKIDDSGMLKDQISMLQNQLKNVPSANQMRMAQMAGGRKKMPRNR
jgi:tetratricopeptide (TPR) repeat protein